MPYKLPPLKREFEPTTKRKSWFKLESDKIDNIFAKAVNTKMSWWRVALLSAIKSTIQLTGYFGKTFPYVYRPWNWLAQFIRYRLNNRFERLHVETFKTLFFRRLFSSTRPTDRKFYPSYALVNWISFVFGIPICFTISLFLLEGLYVYSTYNTYNDVVVTQAYRNITEQSTFSVHGYLELGNGNKEEVYFEIGSNIWHWNLYPEYMFGQVTVNGRCKFDTFGWSLRLWKKLSIFSRGSLYVLNPWIIDVDCTAPSNVPIKPV